MATRFSIRRSRREPPTVGRQKSNYQYHHRSSVCNLQNVFQHGTIFIHKVDFIATSKMRGSKFGQYLIRTRLKSLRGCHGHDCMVVGFTTTYAISSYHYLCCEFKSSTTLHIPFLRNQCLSPVKLWVRTPFMPRCTQYNIMW